MRKLIYILLVFGLVTSNKSAFAKVIFVPKDYDLIQDAVDEAQPGDDIKVMAGIYTEVIKMRDGINLIGAGADVTTIVGLQEGPPVEIITCSEDSILSGFTITGARGKPGHGIVVKDVSPIIRNCIIRDNAYTGIGVHNAKSAPIIENCKVHNNGGAGIANNYGPTATIRGNEIYQNSRSGIGNVGAGTLIVDNYIHDNEFAGIGAISCSGIVIRSNKIENNGGVEIAVLAVEGAPPKQEAIIEKNEINGTGGPPSIICENTSPQIFDNIINNQGSAGIMVIASSVIISSNDISTNGPAGIYIKSGASPIITDNSILGGGVRGIVGDLSEASVSGNQIKENMMMGGFQSMGVPPTSTELMPGFTESPEDGKAGSAFSTTPSTDSESVSPDEWFDEF